MKFIMCEWAYGCKNLPSWFKHDQEADLTIDQIKELYDTGNNVMLCHGKDGVNILFVDDRRFSQRG